MPMASQFEKFPELWGEVTKTLRSDEQMVTAADWWVSSFNPIHPEHTSVFVLTDKRIYISYLKRKLFSDALRWSFTESAELKDVKQSVFTPEKDFSGVVYGLSWTLEIEGCQTDDFYVLYLEDGAADFAEKFTGRLLTIQESQAGIPPREALPVMNKVKADGVLSQEERKRIRRASAKKAQ